MTMIELGTWTTVVVLGPGALAVFIWFLIDLRRMMVNGTTDERR